MSTAFACLHHDSDRFKPTPPAPTRQRFQLSYWDAAIIEAARTMGCTEVLSEDLSDGQDYAGVRVTNPFR